MGAAEQQGRGQQTLSVGQRRLDHLKVLSITIPSQMTDVNSSKLGELVGHLAEYELTSAALLAVWARFCETPNDKDLQGQLSQLMGQLRSLVIDTMGFEPEVMVTDQEGEGASG